MSKTPGAEGTISRDILEFCARHLDRQDTVEGIAEWWLMEHRVDRTIAEVRSVLEWLVEQEMMLRTSGPDGRAYYRINRSKVAEIRELLEAVQEAK
jgi:hypothetical protein